MSVQGVSISSTLPYVLYVPVPLYGMTAVRDPVPGSYTIVTVPSRASASAGVNETASVHVALFTASDDPHVVPLMANSVAGAAVFDVNVIAVVVLVFVSVTVLQALDEPFAMDPQVAETGEMLRGEAVATPLPVRPTNCGLPDALSVIVSVPVAGPVAVGVK